MESEYLINRRAIMLGMKEPPQKEKAKPIAKRSDKMKKIMPELKKKYKAFITTHEACELKMNGCTQKAEVIHHTKGRIGELLMNEKYWKASCAFCNIEVENKDKEAREKGLKLSKHTKQKKMKTATIVKNEIELITSEIKTLNKSEMKKDITLRKRLRAKIPQLKQYANYLETNPTEEYCEKEAKRIQNRIDEILKRYIPPSNPERFTIKQLSDMRRDYEKLWDIPKLKKQLAAINYILK